ncbi:MAG: exodeoxyribonuclease III [Thermovirgaceae bacterium]|nr:exodeoxyribonuclease III [Thermovirgaceae bacterium]
MGRIKVATFNVNSVRSRLSVLERWLHDNKVDIICLQETKVEDQDFPEAFFSDLGYSVAYSGQKSYNGVAVASLVPPDEVFFGFGDGEEPGAETRLARCRFGDLNVLNAYVPQGKEIGNPDYPMKLRFFDRLGNLIRSLGGPDVRLILVGDLNVAPTDIDVTHPENKRDHVCFHVDARNAFEKLCSIGLADVFRKHRPGEGEFTFWDYRVKDALERNIGWRIDHILATPAAAEGSLDCFCDKKPRSWEKPSDHSVVVAEFGGAQCPAVAERE